MELVINGLKIILLALVITYVIFHLGEYVNSLQVKKFKEKEAEDKIILPEKDICDSCKYLRFKNTDEEMKQDDVYRYKCSKFDEYYNSSPERCMYYSPSNRVKQSDITQININNYPDIDIKDDMFDIRPLLESATSVSYAVAEDGKPVMRGKWTKQPKDFDMCGVEYFACSQCGFECQLTYNFCPNCGADMRIK